MLTIETVRARLIEIPGRTRAAVAGLSAERFSALPPDGGWSVAQVFEHLCVANAPYLERTIPEGVARARASRHGARAWRPSLLGGLLLASMREGNRRRLPAPAQWRVGETVRPGVVEAFLSGMADLEVHLAALEGHDWRAGVHSPLSPLLRMNVGDACAVLVEHAHRHLAQAERTRRAVGG